MLEISRSDFFKILNEDNKIGVKLLWNFVTELSKRLRATSQDLVAVKEQMQGVEDLSDELLFDDEPTPEPTSMVPRAPKVPSLRAATVEATADTIMPPAPVTHAVATQSFENAALQPGTIIQRRRVVNVGSEPDLPPAEDHERKTEPPPGGEPSDLIDH
jgi:hypothetical protein